MKNLLTAISGLALVGAILCATAGTVSAQPAGVPYPYWAGSWRPVPLADLRPWAAANVRATTPGPWVPLPSAVPGWRPTIALVPPWTPRPSPVLLWTPLPTHVRSGVWEPIDTAMRVR